MGSKTSTKEKCKKSMQKIKERGVLQLPSPKLFHTITIWKKNNTNTKTKYKNKNTNTKYFFSSQPQIIFSPCCLAKLGDTGRSVTVRGFQLLHHNHWFWWKKMKVKKGLRLCATTGSGENGELEIRFKVLNHNHWFLWKKEELELRLMPLWLSLSQLKPSLPLSSAAVFCSFWGVSRPRTSASLLRPGSDAILNWD